MSESTDEDIRTAQVQDFVFYWSARFCVAISAVKYRARNLKWLQMVDGVQVSDGVTEHEEYFREWQVCFIAETVEFEQFLGRSLLYSRLPQVPGWMRDASRLARQGIVNVPHKKATILDITWPNDDPIFLHCRQVRTTEYLLNRWWELDVPKHESVTLMQSIKAFRAKIGKSWEPQQVARGEDQYLALSIVRAKTQLERTALNLADLRVQEVNNSLEGHEMINSLHEAGIPRA